MVGCINIKTKYQTLGIKRNALLHFSRTKWVCWLDDDDWLLPWYIEKLLYAGNRYPDEDMIQPKYVWFASGSNNDWENIIWQKSTASIQALVKRSKALNKFPAHLDSGEDKLFRTQMKSLKVDLPLGYVYRWANGTYHTSGSGNPVISQEFNHDAQKRIERGEEPEGKIQLIPHLRHNYFRSMPEDVYEKVHAEWGCILPR